MEKDVEKTDESIFDVDKYMNDKGVIIRLKGKDYKVIDIPFGLGELLKESSEESQKEALQQILVCEKGVLVDLGMGAVGHIIRHITENLFPEPSQKNLSND